MLKNNLLEHRLNAINEGKEIDKNITEYKNNIDTNDEYSIYDFILYIVNTVIFLFKSVIYGYSLKTILSVDWSMISFISVGLGISFIFSTSSILGW